MLMLTYVAFVTPFEISFLDPGADAEVTWSRSIIVMFTINRTVDVFFVIDLIMNFMLVSF